MNDPNEVKNILKSLSGIALKKPYYRSISIEYLRDLLNSIGSLQGGRYNLKNSFEVLYMAPDPDTVIAECKKPYNFKIRPTVLITLEVNLQLVLNLQDPQIIKILGIDTKKLLFPWRIPSNKKSYTQTLGRLIYASHKFEGILYPSVKVKNKYNLAVFPDRLKKGSEIKIYDPKKSVESVLFQV